MQLIPGRRKRLSEAELGAWRAFMRAHATLARLADRDLVEAGAVPLSFYGVLVTLAHEPPQGLQLSELAKRLGLTKSGMSRLADRLEDRELIARVSCPSDGRGQHAVLTPLGRRALRRAAPTHLRTIARRFVDRLSPRELGAFGEACEHLARAPA